MPIPLRPLLACLLGWAVCLPLRAEEAGLEPCVDDVHAEASVLRLNLARRVAEACGAGAGPLVWDARLAASARNQAADLAARDTLSHVDSQQHALGWRLRAAGYVMSSAAENLAAGPQEFEEVLAMWLVSPAHCANLMQPVFREVGLACMRRPGSSYERFWVAHFGAPMRR